MTMNSLKWFCLLGLISGTVQASFLLSPQDDARYGRHDPPPVFSWQPVDPHHHYFLDIGIDPSLSEYASIEVNMSETLDLSAWVTPEEWEPLAFRIYWRIRCSDRVSEIRSLTKTRLSAPRVDFPFDARFGPGDPAPVISWTPVAGAWGYCIEFSGDKQFTTPVRMDWTDSVLDLRNEIDPDVWAAFSGYFYFRVWAKDEEGLDGPYYQFFCLSKSILPVPNIGRPSGEAFSARSDPPEFIWGCVQGAAGYQIQLAPEGDWDHAALIFTSTENRLQLGDVLTRDQWEAMWKAYRWRVAVLDPSGAWGPWSEDTFFLKCGKHVITALGDSITTGGACIDDSWFDWTGNRLRLDYDDVILFNAAEGGTKSKWGADIIPSVLEETYPEYILILFGANDAVDPGNCDPPYGCDVAGHLREMVYISRSFGTIPIIGTVLPVNPEGPFAYNQFRVDMYNEEIREMAAEEHVHLVDLNELAWSYGDVSALFCDWGHPNAAGTSLIADAYYEALISYE